MKKLITILLLFIAGLSYGQLYVPAGNTLFTTNNGEIMSKENVVNNGTIYSVEMNSASAQSISGTGSMRYLKANNSSDISLSSSHSITNNGITLTSGKIILGNYNLTAVSVTNDGATRYIKTSGSGVLRMNATTGAYTKFPIGNTTYNYVRIYNNNAAADTFSVRVQDTLYSNAGNSTGSLNNSVNRTWILSKTATNSGSGVNIEFNWNSGDVKGTLTNAVLYEYNGTKWIKANGTQSVSGNQITVTGYTGTLSSKQFMVSSSLGATVSVAASACQNTSGINATFTGSGGTALYTFTYTLNGGSNQTVTTTSGSSVTVSVSTTAAGNQVFSLVNVSDANLQNTVSDSATINIKATSTSTQSASACSSYIWNGTTYTTSGAKTWTGTNAAGCDSVATLNLTIKQPTTSTQSASACSSYIWNGTTYTTSGAKTWTGTNAAGCDSVATLNLTITPQPAMPTLACYETASFNTTTCAWVVTGTQPTMPTLACYETATFNTTTCAWVVTGTQPTMPTLACYETASFNTTSCSWVVTGSQPVMPTLACYETASFNTNTCAWVVTGSQPTMPTLACYETATFNTTTCAWVVTGTQPTMPTLACYETASFNTTSCSWVVTGTQPAMPTLACYETASFNTTTCAWVVTGTQPTMPTLACYETASFNTTTCAWVVTGTQPAMPTLACYQTASFNTTTCTWVVTGTAPSAIVTTTSSCNSYTWSANIQSYTQSGTYSYNANCQDYVLNLTIKQPTTSTQTATACNSYIWHGITYTTSGAKTWTGTNAAGCDSLATLNLTINVGTFNAETRIENSGYTWHGTLYAVSGTYTYSYNNSNGCASVDTLYFVVNTSSSVNLKNVCTYIGTNETLIYTASVAGASSYTWSLPLNTQLVSGQGTRSIVIKILNGFAVQANKQIRVTPAGGSLEVIYLLAQAPVTPSTIVASSTNICKSLGTNVPVTFTIPRVYELASNGRTSTSYIWTAQNGTTTISHPNGTGENDTTVSITFASNFTSSNVSVQALNACGLSTTRSYFISRNNPSQPSLISGPTNTCEYIGINGQVATYSVSASASVDSYTWSVPQGAIGLTGQGTNTISFKYPAGYTGGSISVTATNNCGISPSRSIALSRLTPSTPGYIDVINTATCPNREYTYSLASIPGNATSLLWTVPNGATIVNGQGTRSITVSYPNGVVDGNVTVKAVSNCGVSGVRSLIIKLASCPANPISQNTKGVMSTMPTAMEVKVFPNPTTFSFNLQVTADVSRSAIQARVFDLQGRLMKTLMIHPNENISLGADLKPGVYMLEVLQGEEKKVLRVVKY